ncbi:hypothetical protein B0O99DRAFT_651221 [Bisporella sp. PMI_857]|nr:hypothetical protein B0O99DRAFT_651221 [Bisporella sp. PMI_857]
MYKRSTLTIYTCRRCLRKIHRQHGLSIGPRASPRCFSTHLPLTKTEEAEGKEDIASIEEKIQGRSSGKPSSSPQHGEKEQGAMSRRLAEATEEALYSDGRAGRKAVEEAGFSDELKQKLLDKIQAQNFRAENAASFAEVEASSHLGRGSKDIATAQSWTGLETPEDTVLRMLDDAQKPLKPGLRGKPKIPTPIVDMRLKPEVKRRPGQRLAEARDKSEIYAISKDSQMSEKEREEMRKELKERFQPGARAMPNSIRGMQALANERIEDAIARGQFKNIPRGKAIVRDARADNPFIDTTEYIMNKMIQRQDIVPPWIEKQQELVKTATTFRARLRNDWKRQAARTIASRGGSLQVQMAQAERYAEAERLYNPRKRAVEQISVPTNATSDPVMVSIIQEAPKSAADPTVTVAAEAKRSPVKISTGDPEIPQVTGVLNTLNYASKEESNQVETIILPNSPPKLFRLPEWEKAEMSYLTLAITNLNSLTRSYNLMAPDLAKKPYFSLQRELDSCYADVAPQLSTIIKDRAARPAKILTEVTGSRQGSVLERLGAGESAKVYDSKKPKYGFKEFWADLFTKKEA